VEPVVYLWVNRIRGLDALFVVAASALGWKLGALRLIEICEGSRCDVPLFRCLDTNQRLEQAPSHDLEAFLGSGRTPRRFNAPHYVAEPVECLAPADASNLYVFGLRVRRSRCVGGREGDYQQTITRRLSRLGERLRERE